MFFMHFDGLLHPATLTTSV